MMINLLLIENWKLIHQNYNGEKKDIVLDIQIPTTIFEALIINNIIETL